MTPLIQHKYRERLTHPPMARQNEDLIRSVNDSVRLSSPISASHLMKALPPAPVIPAINEYGSFHSESSSSAEELEKPRLFPSSPSRPSSTTILVDLVPFTTLFSFILSLFGRRREEDADFFPNSGDDIHDDQSNIRRRYAGPNGKKFTPLVPGGGRNIPLEILWYLSEWFGVLEDRGAVPCSVIISGFPFPCLTSLSSEPVGRIVLIPHGPRGKSFRYVQI